MAAAQSSRASPKICASSQVTSDGSRSTAAKPPADQVVLPYFTLQPYAFVSGTFTGCFALSAASASST
jgi:hypothetical protein